MWIIIDWKTFNAELYIDKGHVMVLGCDDSWGIWFVMKSSGRISISWGSQGRLTALHTVATFVRLLSSGKTTTHFRLCIRWQLAERKGCERSISCLSLFDVYKHTFSVWIYHWYSASNVFFFQLWEQINVFDGGSTCRLFVYGDLQPPEGTEVRSLLAGRVPLLLRTAAAIHWVMEK